MVQVRGNIRGIGSGARTLGKTSCGRRKGDGVGQSKQDTPRGIRGGIERQAKVDGSVVV